jgi:hypothetical protein
MHAPASQKSFENAQNPDRGADHLAPDCAGRNFYAIDRGLRGLLPLYLEPNDFRRLEPHFDRLGALAGGRLDELARIGSIITRPTAKWKRSHSAISSFTP